MSDLLLEAAKEYKELMNYEYVISGGTGKRKLILSILSSEANTFTHVSGLDHLKDIPAVTSTKLREKEKIFKNILKGKITYETISKSKYFENSFSDTTNETVFNIKTRIEYITKIKYFFDNIYSGTFYKWNKNKCNLSTTRRNCQISADFMISVPTDKPNINMYLFFFCNNKGKNNEPMKLNLFSAFSDTGSLAAGQQKFLTILKEERINIHTKEVVVLFDRLSGNSTQ